MISFADVLATAFLALLVYLAYLCRRAVDLYEHSNYSDYQAYQKSVRESGSRVPKPARPRDRHGIHTIAGDGAKVTTVEPSGLARTQPALIDLSQADPMEVMNSIDDQGRIKE